MLPCRACVPRNAPPTRLFIQHRRDGFGSVVLNILAGMAIAWSAGVTFGGMHCPATHAAHGSVVEDQVRDFFGFSPFVQMMPVRGLNVASVLALEEHSRDGSLQKHASVLLAGPSSSVLRAIPWRCRTRECVRSLGEKRPGRTMDDVLTPDFLRALWQDLRHAPWTAALMSSTHSHDARRNTVAIHMRRSDRQMVSDAEYMRLCGQLRKRLPAADVHIFSEASGFGSHSNYTRLGATLHLDDSDLLHVYARMLASDVLVVAPSAFSMVPALIQGGLPAGPSRARCPSSTR